MPPEVSLPYIFSSLDAMINLYVWLLVWKNKRGLAAKVGRFPRWKVGIESRERRIYYLLRCPLLQILVRGQDSRVDTSKMMTFPTREPFVLFITCFTYVLGGSRGNGHKLGGRAKGLKERGENGRRRRVKGLVLFEGVVENGRRKESQTYISSLPLLCLSLPLSVSLSIRSVRCCPSCV